MYMFVLQTCVLYLIIESYEAVFFENIDVVVCITNFSHFHVQKNLRDSTLFILHVDFLIILRTLSFGDNNIV